MDERVEFTNLSHAINSKWEKHKQTRWRHKWPKTKIKDTFLKAAREEQVVIYKSFSVRLSADFS